MANNFNIVGRINLQGPNNIRQVVRQIQNQLNSVRANVQINLANNVNQRLNTLNTNLQRIDASLRSIRASANNANQSLQALSNTLSNIRNNVSNINNISSNINNVTKSAGQASKAVQSFGGQAGLAVRRFLAFAAPTSVFLGLVSAIREGVSASIEFEKEMTRVAQVTGRSVSTLSDLSNEITRLATGLGVSSKELSAVSTTIAQAGLSAKDTKVALEALARSSLAATFTDIESTTEGAIATFQQFKVGAEDLEGVVGSLNSVSAQFAVESDDLISAIRRTGGAFKASGGNLNELLGLFTSVRATTRESADSIATGFRTIFTRIQRPRTIQFLKELGVELQNAEGQFIGPLESIRRLNAALSEIETTDPRFAAVIEELGGFRQVSKVIPLIQQFPEALKAISVAEQGQLSIVEDSIVAQQSLANQIVKVKEEFLALFRELTSDKSFQFFIRESLDLAKGLIEVTRAIKPLIPLLGSLALIQAGRSFGGFTSDFASSFGRRKFASGGTVPGSGNGDTVPALLTPGEFVINKKSAAAIGFDTLARMNKFAKGGPVKEFALAGLRPPGFKRRENTSVQYRSPITKKPVKEDVNITAGGLSKSFADTAEDKIRTQVLSVASKMALNLQKTIGAEQAQAANVNSILSKSGFTTTVGNIFETSLALAGAPYTDKESSNAPIDFPGGIGELARIFGIPRNVPTDAKRTVDIAAFKKRNIRNFLRNQATEIGESQGKITKTLTNREKVSNLQSTYDNLPDENKAIVRDVAEGRRKLFSNRTVLEKLFNIKGIKVNQLQTLRFAEGGNVPGTGSGDTVPALLTPGEFVINKRSAALLGENRLKALNSVAKFAKGGPVKKFAKGGPVQPSDKGGFSLEGFGFAASAAISLGSSLLNLEGETAKVVNSLAAITTGASALTFALKSFASEEKVKRTLRLSEILAQNPGSKNLSLFQKDLINANATLVKNFDKLGIGIGVASSALAVFGQSIQNDALQFAKTAKNQSQLNAAISSDATGSALTGAGVGVGIGAAIGTAIAPGIGTAIGAAVGGIAGAITGAINNNQAELIKAFRQARFDESAERLESFFDDFSSGRVGLQRSAPDISRTLRDQLSNISSTTDLTQRGELTKQLRNQLVNVRNLSSEIVKTSSTIKEFESSFGGTGSVLIQTISTLTNRSIPQVIQQLQNEIDARNESVKRQQEESNAVRETERLTVSIRVFNDAIRGVTESLLATQSSFDLLSSLSQGNITGGSFTGIAPDLFSRAAAGNISDPSRVSRAARQLTASLDPDSTKAIDQTVISVTKLTSSLPDILDKVASGIGLTGGAERGEDIFNREIDSLSGVSEELKRVTKAIFASEIASREGGGEGGLAKTIREDLVGFANKLIPEAVKTSVQQLDEVTKSVTEQIDIIGKRLVEVSRLDLAISQQKVSLEEKILEFSRSRLTDGARLSEETIAGAVGRRRTELLTGTGFDIDRPISDFGDRISDISEEIVKQQSILNSAAAGSDAQLGAQKAIVGLQTEAQRLTNFLKDVSDSSIELARAQENLSRAEEDRKAGRNLVEDLLFGDGAGRVAFSRFAKNAGRINRGETDIGRLSESDRKSFLDILNRLPQNAAVPGLGGKTVQEFRNQQLRTSFLSRAEREGADVKAAESLIDALINGTDEEKKARADLISVQNRAIDAEKELIRVNQGLSTAISALTFEDIRKLPDLIKNATIDAITSGLSTQVDFLQRNAGERQAQVGRLDFIGNRLGVDSREGTVELIKRIQANESNFRENAEARQRLGSLRSLPVNINSIADKITDRVPRNLTDSSTIDPNIINDILQEELKNIVQPSDRQAIEKIFVDFLNSLDPRTLVENKDVNRRTFNLTLGKEFEKFIQQQAALAGGNLSRTQGQLSKTFNQEQIEFFTSSKNLDQFLKDIAELDDSFFKSDQGLKKFIENIKNINKEIADVKARIDSLNAGRPAPAEPKARGGFVGGRGINRPLTTFTPRGTDRIPTILSKDEFVVNRAAAKENAEELEAMNAGGFRRGGRARLTREQQRQLLTQRRVDRGVGVFSREKFIANNRTKKEIAAEAKEIRRGTGRLNLTDPITGKLKVPEAGFIKEGFRIPEGGVVGTAARDLFASKNTLTFGRIERKAASARVDRSKELTRIKDSLLFAREERDLRLKGIREELAKRIAERDKALAERKKLRGFAAGGIVPGAGNRDSVPSLLTPGEFVLNRRAAKSLGLNTLKNFNARFQNGGVVTAGSGGGPNAILNLSSESASILQSFSKSFMEGANAFSNGISSFAQMSSQLSNSLSNWSAVAGRLSESLLSFPTEIQVNHSPVVVAVNISGVEGLDKVIQEKVMAAVNQSLSNSRAKAADGKPPFLSR